MDPLIVIVGTLLLAYVFIDAGLHKLSLPLHYRDVISAYRLLPDGVDVGFVYLVAGAELLLGVLLLFPSTHQPAALFASVLLLAYMGAIGINLLRGRVDIDCGCGGTLRVQRLSAWLLLRNGMLVLVALLTLAPPALRELLWLDWLNALFAAAAAVVLYRASTQLLSNRDLLAQL